MSFSGLSPGASDSDIPISAYRLLVLTWFFNIFFVRQTVHSRRPACAANVSIAPCDTVAVNAETSFISPHLMHLICMMLSPRLLACQVLQEIERAARLRFQVGRARDDQHHLPVFSGHKENLAGSRHAELAWEHVLQLRLARLWQRSFLAPLSDGCPINIKRLGHVVVILEMRICLIECDRRFLSVCHFCAILKLGAF